MAQRIAVVEDDPDILRLITQTLEKGGFQVYPFSKGHDFLRYRERKTMELVILDLMLPDMDGLEICKNLRADADTEGIPIVMVTARTDEMDRVLGLELGADDYISKPFSNREMLARIKAVLRRRRPPEVDQVITVGNVLVIDPRTFDVTAEGRKVELTATEFKLLQILAERPGRVLTRDHLLDRLWGNEKYVMDRTIDVHIKNLRDKLGPVGRLIRSIRSVGYKIQPDEE